MVAVIVIIFLVGVFFAGYAARSLPGLAPHPYDRSDALKQFDRKRHRRVWKAGHRGYLLSGNENYIEPVEKKRNLY